MIQKGDLSPGVESFIIRLRLLFNNALREVSGIKLRGS